VLPGLDVGAGRLFAGLAVLVVVNTAVSLLLARASVGTDRAFVGFLARVLLNTAIVVTARLALGGGQMDLKAAMFFVVMLSLITSLHDRHLPVHAARAANVGSEAVSLPSPRSRPHPSARESHR